MLLLREGQTSETWKHSNLSEIEKHQRISIGFFMMQSVHKALNLGANSVRRPGH
jgi:hypothetical protein